MVAHLENFAGIDWLRQDVLCTGGGLGVRLVADSQLYCVLQVG